MACVVELSSCASVHTHVDQVTCLGLRTHPSLTEPFADPTERHDSRGPFTSRGQPNPPFRPAHLAETPPWPLPPAPRPANLPAQPTLRGGPHSQHTHLHDRSAYPATSSRKRPLANTRAPHAKHIARDLPCFPYLHILGKAHRKRLALLSSSSYFRPAIKGDLRYPPSPLRSAIPPHHLCALRSRSSTVRAFQVLARPSPPPTARPTAKPRARRGRRPHGRITT